MRCISNHRALDIDSSSTELHPKLTDASTFFKTSFEPSSCTSWLALYDRKSGKLSANTTSHDLDAMKPSCGWCSSRASTKSRAKTPTLQLQQPIFLQNSILDSRSSSAIVQVSKICNPHSNPSMSLSPQIVASEYGYWFVAPLYTVNPPRRSYLRAWRSGLAALWLTRKNNGF